VYTEFWWGNLRERDHFGPRLIWEGNIQMDIMIIQIPTRCSFLCSLFDGKTLHVSSVTRSSSGVQELCLQPGVLFNYF